MLGVFSPYVLNKLSKYTLIILAAVATTSTSMTTTASVEKGLSDHGGVRGKVIIHGGITSLLKSFTYLYCT